MRFKGVYINNVKFDKNCVFKLQYYDNEKNLEIKIPDKEQNKNMLNFFYQKLISKEIVDITLGENKLKGYIWQYENKKDLNVNIIDIKLFDEVIENETI